MPLSKGGQEMMQKYTELHIIIMQMWLNEI